MSWESRLDNLRLQMISCSDLLQVGSDLRFRTLVFDMRWQAECFHGKLIDLIRGMAAKILDLTSDSQYLSPLS